MGVLALASLVVVVVYDGLANPVSPGSLLAPAETSLLPPSTWVFPMSIVCIRLLVCQLSLQGLLFEGFGCHAVLPEVLVEMKYKVRMGKLA